MGGGEASEQEAGRQSGSKWAVGKHECGKTDWRPGVKAKVPPYSVLLIDRVQGVRGAERGVRGLRADMHLEMAIA